MSTPSGYVPQTIEYDGHRVVEGWMKPSMSRRGTTFRWGTTWYCSGPTGQQSRWCRLCCERNGWAWTSPEDYYRGATTPTWVPA